MDMSFEKVVDQRIWGVTVQNSTARITVGDSTGGTFTGRVNPLKGSLMWDRGMFVLQNVAVAGGATGGSYTVTIETDALVGYTGLPIAQASGLGPNSATTVVMDNLHQSAAIAQPTHMYINQTAAGGGITLTCDVLAKQYRGFLGSPASGTAERVIQGTMLLGGAAGPFTDSRGMTEDETFTLGTSGDARGMHRMRLWDNANFWAVQGVSADGTHDVDIIASVGGATTTIASTGTGGALDVAGDSYSYRVALANNFYGQCPNPTEIIWTEVTAGGVSDARIVVLAKSGRGSMAKR
jgi:hypothetical protein